MTRRQGVLLAVVLALVRCENAPSSDAECHDIGAVNSGGFAASCPTGATQFCADTPIVATSSSQARGACDACFGALACSLSLACGTGPDATSWEGPARIKTCLMNQWRSRSSRSDRRAIPSFNSCSRVWWPRERSRAGDTPTRPAAPTEGGHPEEGDRWSSARAG